MNFKQWVKLLSPPKEYKQSDASDVADSIGLLIICGLLLFVVLL